MPRQARVVAVGVPHHITHRDNNRQDVFLSDEDRRRYQNLLRERLEPCGMALLGWCWMTNHVHLIAVPQRSDSLARLVRSAHAVYAQEFNRRYERSGHLWQSRFFSCALGRDHVLTALAYVDRNSLRAGLVGRAEAYPWSSALAHSSGSDEAGLLDFGELRQVLGFRNWRQQMDAPMEADAIERLRLSTQTGAPIGSERFVAELGRKFHRNVEFRKRGGQPRRASAVAGSS